MSIHTSAVGLLWRVLEAYDIDPATVIPSTMYRPGRNVSDRSYVPAGEYDRVVARAMQLMDDEKSGIHAAALIQPSHFGVFGHAWLASPTLLTSFQMLERYARLVNQELRVRIEEDPHEVRAIYESGESAFSEINVDAQVGGLVHFCRLQYGFDFVPQAVTLVRKEPEDRAAWDDYFGIDVQFEADRNCVHVSASVAREVLTSAHASLFEEHQEKLAQGLAEIDALDIVGQVGAAIQQLLPAGDITEEKVAAIVDTSVRTLHRKLSGRGVSFRTLLRDVRKKLARRYITDSRYSVTDVAFMLGYSDASAFSRAFRSWYGTSPSQFRAASG